MVWRWAPGPDTGIVAPVMWRSTGRRGLPLETPVTQKLVAANSFSTICDFVHFYEIEDLEIRISPFFQFIVTPADVIGIRKRGK